MNADVPGPGADPGLEGMPRVQTGTRFCATCNSPLPAADVGDFCPVCMLRSALGMLQNALGDTAGAGEEPVAGSSVSAWDRRFEHYELVADEAGAPIELGRGAMGITYKALDSDLRRLVALKVINQRYLGDESARSRFLREARAAAGIRHPNLASVFHLGCVGGNYFYAMEFVDGETLERMIRRQGRLGIKPAMELVSQIAAGLAAIHKQGLVHRDIKPSNIMVAVDETGHATAKIIDLGLAKQVNESSSEAAISLPGAFAGTPEFASPEQFAGGDIDIRSDLYSLGLTLWTMLTGQPPFSGDPAEVMYQHQQAPLPVEKLEEIPQPVVALLEMLLKKDPRQRFQNPAEFLEILPIVRGAIATGRPVMKAVRIYISTSGDTQKERNLADGLIRSIGAEFDLPISDSQLKPQRLVEHYPDSPDSDDDPAETLEGTYHPLILCPYFEESHKLQEEIEDHTRCAHPTEFDLVICLVWSRLGPLLESFPMTPDVSGLDSDLEFEAALALSTPEENRRAPPMHIYRNCSKPLPPLEPKEERETFGRQWDTVQQFFARWERTKDKRTATTLSNYDNLEEFEELFRERFRAFLADLLNREVGPKIAVKRVRRWISSPFRGLNVFDFQHAAIFCGRTKAIGDVLEALEQQIRVQRPFVLVVGASGSGKSSLIRAGVLPLLTQPETIEGIGLWRWAVARPGAGGSGGDCFDALAASLLESAALPVLQDLESRDAIRHLAQELRDHSSSVALRVRDALDHAAREWRTERFHRLAERERHLRESDRPDEAELIRKRKEKLEIPKARLALVIDQLEELFTSSFSIEIRENYISAIAGLVRSGRVLVLAALRSDFYPSYQVHPELTDLTKPSGKFDLRPPTPYEIGSMIRLPAEAAGLHFELERRTGQRLDEALRDAASATPESLPLLEHMLSLLYEAQATRGDGLLRWSDYMALGELKGALAKHAESVYGALQPREQKAFPLVMRYLVTLGQGEEEVPNRRTVPYHDFVAAEPSEHDQKAGAKGFVDLFIENRLLVADTDPQGEVTVSVAHEALLREWQRVKDWLADNREFLRMRDRLDASRKLWLGRAKQKDDLLGPGLPLAEGEKLAKDFGPSLSREQTDYIAASLTERRRRNRARERTRYVVMASITIALVVATIFAVVSFRQYRRAERAKVSADQAAQRATRARNEAEKLISFMSTDLRDKLNPIGRLDLLDDVNQKIQAYYRAFVASEDGPEILRQRSIVLVNYGDIRRFRGDLVGALESYQSALVTEKALTKKNPKNAEWQRDLAANLEKIGDVLIAQGKVDDGLDNYRQSLAIRETVAAQDPNNSTWQRELALSYEDLGHVLSAEGRWEGALQNLRQSLLIRQNLATRDPDNALGQRSIFTCLAAIGYVLNARGDLSEALDVYRSSLGITQALTAKDPTDANFQRDLSISLERIGDVLKAQGNLNDALNSFRDSLAIRQKLADRDATNSLWQSDVAWSYQEIGDVLIAQHNIEAGLQNYYDSLTIAQRLTKQDPSNQEWQSGLAIIYEKIGEALMAQGDPAKALVEYHNSLAIGEKLTKQEPKNAQWATAEALACFRIAIALTQSAPGTNADVHSMLARARDILLELKKRSALGASDEHYLKEIQIAMGAL
jgi:eukaryotic-like serine/threonine-protein kinase